MRYFRSNLFVPSPEQRDEPLHVHTRLAQGVNPTVTIFVHGWGGSRQKTWGNFPRFIFEEFTDVDVALFDYVSGLRRIRRSGSVGLAMTTRELADLIREIEHEKVILIGHSLGGIICMAAIKQLIDANSRDGRHGQLTVERIQGLFLLATPQEGSSLARAIKFTTDGRVLHPRSAFVREIQERFSDRIQTFGDFRDPDRFYIPTRALIASRDRVVKATSARLNLPHRSTYIDRASHTSSVKPISPESGGYRWITAQIRQMINPRDLSATIQFSASDVYDRRERTRAHRETSGQSYSDPSGKTQDFPSFRYTHEVPDQPSRPHPVLYVPFGDDKGKSFPLTKETTTIGRSPDCDIRLQDESVSRNHAVIVKTRSKYVVRDLGSRNGTYIDHQPIEQDTFLLPGSVLQIGINRFVFLGASS